MNENNDVPFIVHESEVDRLEREARRWRIAVILMAIATILNGAALLIRVLG